MFRGVPFGIKLEGDCSIDRRILAIRVTMHAETDLGTGLQSDTGAIFKLMTVIADTIGLKIGLSAIRIDRCRTRVMKRFMAFDSLDLDRLHITIFGHAEVDDDIFPDIRRLGWYELVLRPLHYQIR